ncbi:ML domain-containing protein [Streptomyces sp. NPDC058001]|uniref:ML domain-containing protein n=1 Tax=Streptomyces sp. NPDC058001 TaxID=3346300 RepID=UPI0036E1989B
MRVSRRVGAAVPGALSLLLTASIAGSAHATSPTGTAHIAAQASRAAESWPVEDCSDESYILRTDSITAEPKPLEPGKPLTITVHGHLTEEIREGAAVQVTVKLGLVTLQHQTLDLAKELKARDAPVQVPVKPGNISLPIYYGDLFANKEIPRGDFRISVAAYNNDDADLACARAHMNLRRG